MVFAVMCCRKYPEGLAGDLYTLKICKGSLKDQMLRDLKSAALKQRFEDG